MAQMLTGPVKLIFGKSLVASEVSDDVFAGVVPEGVPFRRAPGFTAIPYSQPVLEIGDPWNYYRRFWQAHGLDHLASVVSPEITVKIGGELVIPLIIENPLDTSISVDLSVHAPQGWDVEPVTSVSINPHAHCYLRVRAAVPRTAATGMQQVSVSAKSASENIGTVSLSVELSAGWVAPQ